MDLGLSLHPATHWHGHITPLSFNFVISKMKDKSTSLQGLCRRPREMMYVELCTESATELTNSTVVGFNNQEQGRLKLR